MQFNKNTSLGGSNIIGLIVSNKLKLNFFDIDKEIEKELGVKILEIFETKGESYFRKIEEDITLKILKKKNIVVSLGGGTFLNKNIRDEILENHVSFWLNWSSKILIQRIQDSSKRPIAYKANNKVLIDLIEKRSKIYSKALYKINCDNLTKKMVLNKILDIYETKKNNC